MTNHFWHLDDESVLTVDGCLYSAAALLSATSNGVTHILGWSVRQAQSREANQLHQGLKIVWERMWKIYRKVTVSGRVCIFRMHACTPVSDCLFLGTTAGWWTWRSWCWRSDMMQRCGERAPRARAPAVAWILFWCTEQGRRADPLGLFLLYLSSRKQQNSMDSS